jgi:hypothetical protein
MKNTKSTLLRALVLSGLQFALAGCIGVVGGGGYYRGDPWYHDGPWIDGGPRIGVGFDIHPPGFRR